VQVDPVKPTLTAPGTKRLTLKYYILLSNFNFKFNMRRCTEVQLRTSVRVYREMPGRGLHSSTFPLNLSAFHGIGVRVGVV